jgi:uracil-DNA glycosylase
MVLLRYLWVSLGASTLRVLPSPHPAEIMLNTARKREARTHTPSLVRDVIEGEPVRLGAGPCDIA